MSGVDLIGILAGIFTTFAIIPQIYKAIKTGKVEDISPVFLSVLIAGVGLWTVYGVFLKDYPIIITNGVSVVLNSTMLIIYLNSNHRTNL
ncbi:SemiSWEET family sugar transporter [Winogradskyella ouciana]|uniref:MtN3 and saliva related transmembrane protein n=1 Tax=Winogradskyella ouciana TaxID=2608631 RepID=A0A7K1GAZ2_9FLAO|nr:SemiSWEET transporter [Winogradskyella ouciana]MTE26462.1 hypothetical protein [Winogradskyella ouciana]